MDDKFFSDVNRLLARADEAQRAFELTHLTPTPESTREKVFALTEKDINELVMLKLEKFASALGAEIGQIEKRIRQELRAELEAEVGQLRAEITVSSSNDKLINFGKWRSDAA